MAIALACSACAERPINAELLTDQFSTAAIEQRDNGRVIRKWNQPLRFHLSGNESAIEKHRNAVETHAKTFGALAGLPIEFVGERNDANVLIIFVRRFDFAETLRTLSDGKIAATSGERSKISRTLCITYRADRDHELQFALMLVGVDNEPAILRECIPHEMAHVFGTNHSNLIVPSIFSDQNYLLTLGAGSSFAPIVAPTWHDRIVLKALYDKRLKPGMNAQQAGPLVKEVIEELLAKMKR